MLDSELLKKKRKQKRFPEPSQGIHLNGHQSISIAVLTDNQDDVALINITLRDAVHAAHCHWLNQPAKRSLQPAYAGYLLREWNGEHAAERHVAWLELVKIDASRADEPISKLPREVLWRGGPRPSGCRS